MKIHQPITFNNIPPLVNGGGGRGGGRFKYQWLYDRIDALEPEQWLPVELPNVYQAQCIETCARQQGYLVKRRGRVVYLSRRS